MKKSEYFTIVSQWSSVYGLPIKAFRYDPTEVRTCCAKCKKMKSCMARHHKSNDFFFALNFPDLYAKRYIQFLPEDVVKLCDDCHHAIERYSKKLKEELYVEFAAVKALKYSSENAHLWAEAWRLKFSNHYDKWVAKPVRKKRRKKSRLKCK